MSHIYCIWQLKQIAFVFNDHQMTSEKKKKWFPLLDCFLMEWKRGSGDYHIPICSSLPSTKNSISGSEKCLMCERNIKTHGTSLFMKKDIAMQKRLALRPQSQSLRDWSAIRLLGKMYIPQQILVMALITTRLRERHWLICRNSPFTLWTLNTDSHLH